MFIKEGDVFYVRELNEKWHYKRMSQHPKTKMWTVVVWYNGWKPGEVIEVKHMILEEAIACLPERCF